MPRVMSHLHELGLSIYIKARFSNKASLDVPPLDLLKGLLEKNGIAPELLQPMKARYLGSYQSIKWLQHPVKCENGFVRFNAMWKGKLPPSQVCCHDLNASARDYVSYPSCLHSCDPDFFPV